MEPRIQYAKTSDGVSIAWAEAGEGRDLVSMNAQGFSHVELTWRIHPDIFPPLASRFRTVWYDARGTGLSDRDAIDFSIEAMILDLDAVVACARLDSFELVAWSTAAPSAVAYAVAHPERVSHLVLCDGWASPSEVTDLPAHRASVALLETDWMLFTDTMGQVLWAYSNPEYGRQMGEFIRACCEPEAFRAGWTAWESHDITSLLPQVAAPTLVVHNRGNRMSPLPVGQRIAAAIPGAQFAPIDDITYGVVPDLVDAFVHEGEARDGVLPSGTAVILFADIADSTGLTERLGDAAFREKARELDAALRAAIRESGGKPVEGKLLGDGVLAVFTSAREGIAAALACRERGRQAGLPLHLGLHAGDVLREEGNVYGGAVNIAARISAASAPGELLVSETVRSLARTSAGVRFEDRGERALKGVSERVRIWAVEGR